MLSQKFPIPSPCSAPLPTHSHFLALAFPCTGAYKVCKTKGPLFPLHMWLETLVLGYWVVHIVVLFRNFSPVPISSRLFPTLSSISFSVSGFM